MTISSVSSTIEVRFNNVETIDFLSSYVSLSLFASLPLCLLTPSFSPAEFHQYQRREIFCWMNKAVGNTTDK